MKTNPYKQFRDKITAGEPDLEVLASLILEDPDVLNKALENLTEKNETIRYNTFRSIKMITESDPGFIYPYWDFFISQLESSNTYHILVGVHILADLTAADPEARFEILFDDYYDLLNHKSMIVVSHVCLASGRIMIHKPGLIARIEDKLLNIDRFIKQQKHKDLIKGAVMEAFTEARALTVRNDEIKEFARTLSHSSESPKSRKLAKKYLETEPGQD
jgi:hypothetical protein